MYKKNLSLICVIGLALLTVLAPLLSGAEGAEKKVEKIEKNRILRTNQDWHDNYLRYRADRAFLEAVIQKIGTNLKIDVYLGLWCSDSRDNVPPFIKLIETIRPGEITVNYYTVERKANKEIKYFVDDLKVERVPTFIFYRDGKEIGRIVEKPQNSLIEDFLDIIF